MGLLSDLVIADRCEAQAVCDTPRVADRWPTLEFRRVDNAVLAALARARGDEAGGAFVESEAAILAMRSDCGPWVILVPDTTRDRLAAIDDETRPMIAARWAGEEEMSFHGVTSADLDPVLDQLRPFALRAVTEGKSILLWMAL